MVYTPKSIDHLIILRFEPILLFFFAVNNSTGANIF